MRVPILLLSLIAAGLSGCFVYATPPPPSPHAARVLATNDLGCPYEALNVVPIGGSEYLAYGCGRRETFACVPGRDDGEMQCDPIVVRHDDGHIVQATYAAPPPTCYAACSATSSATCAVACNGQPTPAP